MAASIANVAEINTDQIKTFKDFLTSYYKLSEICFLDCVNDFTSRTVKPGEDKCTANCTEKYLKMNQLILQRFEGFQIISNENMATEAQKAAN